MPVPRLGQHGIQRVLCLIDGARNAAVAIVKRMKSDEPQVRQPRLDQWWFGRFAVGSGQEAPDLRFQGVGWRCFETDALASQRP
jgi:hypothetical protein